MNTKSARSLPPLPSGSRRTLLFLAALAGLAMALALAAPVDAVPWTQDSPLAPQADVSPLATPTVAAAPTARPTEPVPAPATPTPAPAAPPATTPRLSVAGLAAIMAVIAAIALVIGLRRK